MFLRPLMLLLAAALATATPSLAQDPRQPRERAALTEILVAFRAGTPVTVRSLLAARHGGVIVGSNHALGYDRIRLTGTRSLEVAQSGLAAEPSVRWAEPNGTYEAFACTDCPQDAFLRPLSDPLGSGENQWGVFATGIPWLWRQGGGGDAGVKIAIVDSGIDDFASPHADLAANVVGTGHDFVDDDADPTDAGAFRGHGTHVAGIAAAVANGSGIAGVAYASKLLIVRVLDCAAGSTCPGSYDDVASGIQYAADQGARVINLSLGGPVASAAVRTAVQYAIARKAIVVAASGNDSATTVSYPAGFPEVIAVGACDSLDQVPAFSNSGAALDLVAPGTRILSTWPGGGYQLASGTSQATPLVAGVAAIIASRQPAITQEEMERYLRAHAQPLAGANAERDGAGRLAFPRLTDWSDLPPPYSAVAHGEFLWEWLGFDASAEPSIADPLDTDFRPNIGGAHHADGYDDGVLPASIPRLPLLPAHFTPGAALDLGLSVSRFDGPRYSADPSKSLHLDLWADWDSDGAFEQSVPASAEHVIVDHVENPATWGANGKLVTRPIAPVAEHILGNPLWLRTRLAYGASAGHPDSMARYGEVEDHHIVNFVEDFDTGRRVHSPGVYTVMDTWSVAPDPSGGCSHRGAFQMAASTHPAVGAPCNGFIERINVMGTPTMNWEEYTTATLRFWYCHTRNNCSPAGDFCRVRIDTCGTKVDLGPIPTGSGVMSIDLSPFVGCEAVIVEFVEHTDWNGRVAIDDVVIGAWDDRRPAAITGLSAWRPSGEQRVELTWTAPAENESAPPSAQPLANFHDVRYSAAPITSEAAWAAAQRVDPREWTGGTWLPAWPGVLQSARFAAPSAFQSYHFAVKTGDEVTQVAALSNSPFVGTPPALGVSATPEADTSVVLGDTLEIRFTIKNLGETADSYAIEAIDTRGWPLFDLPSLVSLAPGAETMFVLSGLAASGSPGDRDSVTLTAWSLADSSVRATAMSEVEILGTTEAPDIPEALETAGLHAIGPNPFRGELRFELGLPRTEAASLGVYDLSGRLVRRLAEGELSAGRHAMRWDGRDAHGAPAASGMYYLRLRAGAIEQSRAVLRVR